MNRWTVFLCYAKEDRESALRLKNALVRRGIKNVWFDEHALRGGQEPWPDTTIAAIRASRYFVALLSSRSVTKKGFVQKEIREALDRLDRHPPGTIYLVPVRLDPCQPSHPRLNEIQWIDLFPSWRRGLNRLMQSIAPHRLRRSRRQGGPTLPFSGVYVAETPGGTWYDYHYLRFFRDRTVVAVPSNYTVRTMATVLTKDNLYLSMGIYSTTGAALRFVTLGRNGAVINYEGLIGFKSLMLKKHSFTNGHRDIVEYRFHKCDFPDARTEAQQPNPRLETDAEGATQPKR